MRVMKNSEAEWMGEIPKEWDLAKIGNLYDLRIQKVSDRDYAPLSVTKFGIIPQLDSAAKTNAHDDRKLVKKNDFVINSRSDRRGSCGISKYDGSVSLINTVLFPISPMDVRYNDWLFHTIQFADEFYCWGHGIVDDLWTTGWQDMKKIVIPQPSLSEQHRIADFLDTKCAKIDSLVTTIQSEIATLEQYKRSLITEAVTKGLDPKKEMKESGIEWIGEVPKEWNHDSLRHLLVSRGTGAWGEELSADDSGTICLRVADCDFFKARFKDSPPDKLTHRKYSNEQINKLHLKPGDILIEKSGTPGRTVLFDKDYLALFSNFMECLRFDSRIVSSKYMEYWLMAWYACGCSNYYINQTTYANIDLTLMLTKEHAYFPTLPEQKRITDILDSKCGKIDAIIDRLKSKLADLESYKKSLIFEYVTGKKEVPAA